MSKTWSDFEDSVAALSQAWHTSYLLPPPALQWGTCLAQLKPVVEASGRCMSLLEMALHGTAWHSMAQHGTACSKVFLVVCNGICALILAGSLMIQGDLMILMGFAISQTGSKRKQQQEHPGRSDGLTRFAFLIFQ
jgi:hypothetical protein